MSIFKDIKGYEGSYQINLEGEVKSLEREIIIKNNIIRVKECIRKHNHNTQGVRVMQLSLNGDSTMRFISDLIKEAFQDEKEI